MKQQNYSNYKRYYIPHHFILLPLLTILIIVGIRKACTDQIHSLDWSLFTIIIFCILYLAIMLRQHYALGNQNRIVRLEFKLRYFEIFGKRSNLIEQQLSFSQIAALRFADDTEFVDLLERALKNSLTAKEIKKEIRNWQADNNRI
ncbi:MAG TPA: DUF6526 family protein [Ferruginibacter sp.]|nr:DUF6526 family protein [Ferruginibacter sp.]